MSRRTARTRRSRPEKRKRKVRTSGESVPSARHTYLRGPPSHGEDHLDGIINMTSLHQAYRDSWCLPTGPRATMARPAPYSTRTHRNDHTESRVRACRMNG